MSCASALEAVRLVLLLCLFRERGTAPSVSPERAAAGVSNAGAGSVRQGRFLSLFLAWAPSEALWRACEVR